MFIFFKHLMIHFGFIEPLQRREPSVSSGCFQMVIGLIGVAFTLVILVILFRAI